MVTGLVLRIQCADVGFICHKCPRHWASGTRPPPPPSLRSFQDTRCSLFC